MRTVIIGAVTGVCFCVLVVAVLGTIAGYSDPSGFPPGLLRGWPRTVVGCLWALAYFGPLAAAAGTLVGGIVGGVGASIAWVVAKTAPQRVSVGPRGEGR